MYLGFYGLSRRPFSITPDPEVLYLGDTHAGAMAHLEYGLAEGAGFTLLTGEVGAGKTTLVRRLLKSMGEDFVVAQVFNTNVTATELLKLVLAEYEVAPGADKADHLVKLQEHLIGLYARGKRSVLVVDEAQNLSREALEEMRMLSNLQTETEPLLHILLVGQPELRDRIRQPDLAQLAQRITVHCHLGALSREEAAHYIDFRLREAGAAHKDIFTPEAVQRIHELAEGLPRALNTLCDACLMTGYVERIARINLDMVEAVQKARAEGRTLPRLPDRLPEPPQPPLPPRRVAPPARVPPPPVAPRWRPEPTAPSVPAGLDGMPGFEGAGGFDGIPGFDEMVGSGGPAAPPEPVIPAYSEPTLSQDDMLRQMAELNRRLAAQERAFQEGLRTLNEEARADIAEVLGDAPQAPAPIIPRQTWLHRLLLKVFPWRRY